MSHLGHTKTLSNEIQYEILPRACKNEISAKRRNADIEIKIS